MAKKYKHLTIYERDRIANLLKDGANKSAIASVIGVHPSTISREIARNSRSIRSRHGTPGEYSSSVAQQKAYVAHQSKRKQAMKIINNPLLKRFIVKKLKQGWSPDQISGYLKVNTKLKAKYGYVSKNSIYRYLDSPEGFRYSEHLHSRRKHPWRKKPKSKSGHKKRVMIPDRIPIQERSADVDYKLSVGDWEADTVVSPKNGSKQAVVVLKDRTSRYLAARIIPNLKPSVFSLVAIEILKDKLTNTITMDNGIENRYHGDISMVTGAKIYFCDPYSSWQKGAVENINGILRRYFPKGTDFANITQAELDKAVFLINNKPRKILGYKSALQVAKEKGLFIKRDNIINKGKKGTIVQ
jgi:IS30 family transposase